MPILVDSLKTRYNAVFLSDSDSLFYQNLHHYFDLIEKTPELQALWLESEKEYHAKHTAIWGREKCKTDEEAVEKHELTMRLERFNMFCHGCTIYMRVYLPIEDYKNSIEPGVEQDPIALLMIRGIDRISPNLAKKNPFKWRRERLKVYNRWFVGQRGTYEQDLRQFHLALLAAIEDKQKATAAPVEKPHTRKLPINFNYRTGDFTYQGVSDNLTPNGQEYKVLKALLESEDNLASYFQLILAMHPTAQTDSKSARADLYKVILRLKSKMDIFQNVKGSGYRLVFPSSEQKAE